MSNRISKIRVKGVDYEVRSKRGSATKTINSLSSIPVDVESIVANISNSTNFSLASNMNKGDHIDLLCIPSSDFLQEISGDNIKTTFDGKILVKNGQPFKLYINCYDTDKIFIDASNVENATDYITISTSSSGDVTIYKLLDSTGSSTEEIIIPASSTDYKIDGLIYGFKMLQSNDGNAVYITSLDVSYFDTSNMTNMEEMFSYCNADLLDVSNFDTSKVTDMSYMFQSCSTNSLDVSNFDTSKVTDMSYMFSGCGANSLDVSNFDTSKVTNMSSMFSGCGANSLDVSNFDTSKVTNMSSMFSDCVSLTSLNVSNFDTSNVTDMTGMFSDCLALTHIKCKQAFKDWCWTNQDTIYLPDAMRDGGSGTWEIVG